MHVSAATIRTAGIVLLSLFGALCSAPAAAETQNFSAVQSALQQRDYDAAEKRVDAILKAEPDNVNALMYMGNIIFLRNSNTDAIQVYGNEDESIYDTGIGEIGQGSSLISKEAARQAAAYYRRALAKAPQRMDIQLGLCWTYANAGMKDELIARFPELRKYGAQRAGLQYNMGDYARVIIDHYSFDDGIAVYREIARLYPDDGNLSSDIAAMYLKHRDLSTAMKYFAEAASKKNHDDSTWQNLALFYAVSGDWDKSLAAQKTLSQLRKDETWALYDALCKRLRHDPHWQEQASAFARRHKGDPAYRDYVAFAEAILPVNGRYPPAQFTKAKALQVRSNFQLLNDEGLLREAPDRLDVAFDLANAMSVYNNYPRALQILDGAEKAGLVRTPEDADHVHLVQAWSLYASGQAEAANAKWKLLLNAGDFYPRSAAAYFLADYAYRHKSYKEAADYCRLVKDEASKSKYANYCSNLYEQVAGKP
jgi:hypothetical protein